MTTNQYNQPVDSKGHVLRQSEIVAEELDSLIDTHTKALTQYTEILGNDAVPELGKAGDQITITDYDTRLVYTTELVKALTTYCMKQKNQDFYRGDRNGQLAAYKRVVAMLEALLAGVELGYLATQELQAVITALTKETEQLQ